MEAGGMVAENEALREQVRQLRALLCEGIVAPPEWRLTPSERTIFGVLATRRVATHNALMAALYADRPGDWPDVAILKTLVSTLRTKLFRHDIGIVTLKCEGWALDAEGRAVVRGLRN